MEKSKNIIGIVLTVFALLCLVAIFVLPSENGFIQIVLVIGGILAVIIGVLSKLPGIINFIEERLFFSSLEINIKVVDDPTKVMEYREKELGQSSEMLKSKGTNPIIEITLHNPTKRNIYVKKVNFDVKRPKKGIWKNPQTTLLLHRIPVNPEYDITFDPRRRTQSVVCEMSQLVKAGDADRIPIVVGHKYDSNNISNQKAYEYKTSYEFSVSIIYGNNMIKSEFKYKIKVSSQFDEGKKRGNAIIILP